MTWLQRYRLRQFLKTSFWFWPFVVVLISLFVALPMVDWFTAHDYQLGFLWHDLTAARARVVLSSFSASMLTFLVFVLSSLVMVVQLASAQLTPRIMAITFSDIQGRIMTCMLLFSFFMGTAILGRIEDDHVPVLGIKITVISVLLSIILFLRFIPHLGLSLRPISMMRSVTDQALSVIASVYPQPFDAAGSVQTARPPEMLRNDVRVIDYDGHSGVFMAFSESELVGIARSADCIIELMAQVGDFISRGDPFFRIYPADRSIDVRTLHQAVAIGPERTIEQDPAFALRIIVDIALRALSPAINDPSTAVLAIDQIHRLLRYTGFRQLKSGMISDGKGKPRLIVLFPKWEDFVCLAVSEIRLYGAGSIQVPRRLRAMLEHLIGILPASRIPALRLELALLHNAVEREHTDADDRKQAETGDRQGVGGYTKENP